MQNQKGITLTKNDNQNTFVNLTEYREALFALLNNPRLLGISNTEIDIVGVFDLMCVVTGKEIPIETNLRYLRIVTNPSAGDFHFLREKSKKSIRRRRIIISTYLKGGWELIDSHHDSIFEKLEHDLIHDKCYSCRFFTCKQEISALKEEIDSLKELCKN